MEPLRMAGRELRYDCLVGTGGIGTGIFFALNANHTLGREESRTGRFVDQRDYCKLHIIAHYVQVLLGSAFRTYPVGKVGDDDAGRRLLAEMEEAGLNLAHTRVLPGEQTLNCICLTYPDGSGGNLTVDNAASSQVTPEDVRAAEPLFRAHRGRGIGLAVPEVPLEARAALLDLAGKHGFLRAASFLSEEMERVRAESLLSKADLLAINCDEAARLADVPTGGDPEAVVREAACILSEAYPHLVLSVTAGRYGSWVCEGGRLHHVAALPVEARSAAGAGDAHFAGVLVGLAAGLRLAEAHVLGALVGALSVTSPHTIHKGIDRGSLRELALAQPAPPPPAVLALLGA